MGVGDRDRGFELRRPAFQSNSDAPCWSPKRETSECNRTERPVQSSDVWRLVVCSGRMLKVKDTLRATVHLTFDGRVIKAYHGADAGARFAKEVRILRFLEAQGCGFVPKLLEADPDRLRIVTSNCGSRVEHLDEKRTRELFAELEQFGVRHDDPDMRNVTYRQADGRFCVIDFEFATILPGFG